MPFFVMGAVPVSRIQYIGFSRICQEKVLPSPCGALDESAGDLCAGVAGGLGDEVVRLVVEDQRFAEDFVHGEPIGQKYG